MRNFINIITEAEKSQGYEILTEAQDYYAMVRKYVDYLMPIDPDLANKLKEQMNNEIKWAKAELKRKDRIIWFLRYVRWVYSADALINGGLVKEVYEPALKTFWKMPDPHSGKIKLFDVRPLYFLKLSLMHYLDLNIPAINNYVFSDQKIEEVFEFMLEVEEKWKREQDEHISVSDQQEKVIIDFGDGWYWIDLQKRWCNKESAAMGHCGNRGSNDHNDNILSLRKKVIKNGQEYWRPSLTFIIDGNGFLGEMKGRGNDKPAEKYHPYITELLKNPIVKGIKGGGYLPENNFSLADLTDEQREEVFEANNILSPTLFYKKWGWTYELERLVRETAKFNGQYYKDGFLVYSFNSKAEAIRNFCTASVWANIKNNPDNIDDIYNRLKNKLKNITLDERNTVEGLRIKGYVDFGLVAYVLEHQDELLRNYDGQTINFWEPDFPFIPAELLKS